MPLRVRDLTVARGGWPVLEGVSFDLADGAALILRGPNGIGKTTLLRTIAGLQPPVRGTIDGAGDSIAYASHADGIKDALSVEESLDFWARIHGRGVPDEVYARFALEGCAGAGGHSVLRAEAAAGPCAACGREPPDPAS